MLLHDRVRLHHDEFKTVISELKLHLELEGKDTPEEIILRDEKRKISMQASINPEKEKIILVLDYPENEKNVLEKILNLKLSGTIRIPSLVEVAETMLPYSDKIENPKEELKQIFGLTEEQVQTFVADLHRSAARKRAPMPVKDLGALFKKE